MLLHTDIPHTYHGNASVHTIEQQQPLSFPSSSSLRSAETEMQLETLKSALSANLDYAASLKQQLQTLRLQLLYNLEKRRLLRCQKMMKEWNSYSTGRRCSVVRREKMFDAPYFVYFVQKLKKTKGIEYAVSEPPNNQDTLHWQQRSKIVHTDSTNNAFQAYLPVFHLSKSISKIEKTIIVTSARCEYIEKAKQKLMQTNNDGDNHINHIGDEDGVRFNNTLRSKLLALDSCTPIEIDSTLLDWRRIADYHIAKHKAKLSEDIQIVKHREITEYEQIWKNYILCDTSSWTRKEANILSDIVRKYKGHRWTQIHDEFIDRLKQENMYKNRTCLSIFRYFQQFMNKIHTRPEWDGVDDNMLIQLSKQFGDKDHMSQSYYLDRRLPHQCAARLQHATGNIKVVWNEMDDLTLLLVVQSFVNSQINDSNHTHNDDNNEEDGESLSPPRKRRKCSDLQLKNTWSKARVYVPPKTDSQCRERYSQQLMPLIDERLLNIQQIIYIMETLYAHKGNLWNKWHDISYILSWFEYNYWNETYMKWKKIENKQMKNSKEMTKYSKPLLQLKKDKIYKQCYVNPTIIAALFVLLFGGYDGGKLFRDDAYCTELLSLFHRLKECAIQCQRRQMQAIREERDIESEITTYKRKIETLVNDEKFVFDKCIENVVSNTIYFHPDIDAITNYKRLYRHQHPQDNTD